MLTVACSYDSIVMAESSDGSSSAVNVRKSISISNESLRSIRIQGIYGAAVCRVTFRKSPIQSDELMNRKLVRIVV